MRTHLTLSPPRFSTPPFNPKRLGKGKGSKHPIPPYPPTWESVGFGLTLQQLALGLANYDPTVGSFKSLRLLGVTNISGQNLYSVVTHSWTLHIVPEINKKSPHCWDLNKSIALKSCTFSPTCRPLPAESLSQPERRPTIVPGSTTRKSACLGHKD